MEIVDLYTFIGPNQRFSRIASSIPVMQVRQ